MAGAARLVGPVAAGRVLAVELDVARMRTAYLFFPLWLGYILVTDALVLARAGHFVVDAFPQGLRAAVFRVSAGVVVV